MLFHQQHLDAEAADELPKGFLRLGLELADGARVSNLGWRRVHRLAFDPDAVPEGPLFFQHGGGGGTGGADRAILRHDYWLWPLPPAGPIRVSCEWPLVGIPLSSVEVDGAALVDAAAGVVTLWPNP